VESVTSELTELLKALEGCPPNQLTGSHPWTAHELTAHLAAGADEIGRHLEALLDGAPIPTTKQGDEREQRFRDLPDAELRDVFNERQDALVVLLDEALERDPQASFDFGGTAVPVWAMANHVRLEASVHRWDLVGDDDVNDRQLSDPDLIGHSVLALGPALMEKGLAQYQGSPVNFRLRADGQPDVMIQASTAGGGMVVQPSDDAEASIEGDPAARLLFLWGRRPGDPGRLRSNLKTEDLVTLSGLLQGF
jgi:hypothetical protein